MKLLAAVSLVITLAVLGVAAPATAQVQQVPTTSACAIIIGSFVTNLTHGEVGWVTDGRTSANFADCPIPGGFFGPGSDPLGNQDISLDGVALTGQTGTIDTLIEVDGIKCLQVGQTKSMGTRIRGLHMSGSATVTFNGGGSVETWDLDVYSAANQNSGSMSVTLDDAFGGTYVSSLPVVARLVFTDPGTGAQHILEDPSCEIHFDSDVTPWVLAADGKFNPSAQGLPPLPGGVSVDGNGDGSPDYITAGRTNFIPGVEHTGGDGLIALGSDGLTSSDTTIGGTTISPWKWWLFRELYLLFKHFVWIKPVNPRIDVVNQQPVGVVFETNTAGN